MYLSIQSIATATLEAAKNNPIPYIGILTFLYELLVRIRPTAKNLSLLDKIHTLLNLLIPNWKKQTIDEVNKKIEKSKFKNK